MRRFPSAKTAARICTQQALQIRPWGRTLGGVYAYRSTPRNAHHGPSRRFLAADVPRQPTGQPGPVRFHGVALRLRRTSTTGTHPMHCCMAPKERLTDRRSENM
ncbi:hypothetical protein ALC56_14821 [Trachymyrmex septentrionalis]|uniref:Uncharacterized protein n=1 Tax=Trachymyrmex septentrionalis TaxID=34720 RepID=A0A195ESZ9_9HYME|nr:hypothetical protein ALC56_14821 [Trachymyrmex septentrionalis]